VTADEGICYEYVWALRLALARCAGNADACADTLREINECGGCAACVLRHVLDLLACVAGDRELNWLTGQLADALDQQTR
jgi:hypothetical protein